MSVVTNITWLGIASTDTSTTHSFVRSVFPAAVATTVARPPLSGVIFPSTSILRISALCASFSDHNTARLDAVSGRTFASSFVGVPTIAVSVAGNSISVGSTKSVTTFTFKVADSVGNAEGWIVTVVSRPSVIPSTSILNGWMINPYSSYWGVQVTAITGSAGVTLIVPLKWAEGGSRVTFTGYFFPSFFITSSFCESFKPFTSGALICTL